MLLLGDSTKKGSLVIVTFRNTKNGCLFSHAAAGSIQKEGKFPSSSIFVFVESAQLYDVKKVHSK